MATVLSIFGTRPEVIKIAPLLEAFRHYPDCIHPVTCATGQHREMLTQALDLFDLKPDYSLDVMQTDQSLPQLTSILLNELDAVVDTVKPDWILAVGDTTTVFVASLVAYYHQIAFGHIEAGLRTGDKYKPYPEEINRRITDQIADLLFAPTERARQALLQEGHAPDKIHVTGNTVVDALLDMAARPYDWVSGPLSVLPEGQRLVVITAHRRESFGAPLYEICMAIHTLAEQFAHDNVHFVYPVHPNPNVKQPVYEWLSDLPNVSLIESLDYLAFVHLMRRATLILTDLGWNSRRSADFWCAGARHARGNRTFGRN